MQPITCPKCLHLLLELIPKSRGTPESWQTFFQWKFLLVHLTQVQSHAPHAIFVLHLMELSFEAYCVVCGSLRFWLHTNQNRTCVSLLHTFSKSYMTCMVTAAAHFWHPLCTTASSMSSKVRSRRGEATHLPLLDLARLLLFPIPLLAEIRSLQATSLHCDSRSNRSCYCLNFCLLSCCHPNTLDPRYRFHINFLDLPSSLSSYHAHLRSTFCQP